MRIGRTLLKGFKGVGHLGQVFKHLFGKVWGGDALRVGARRRVGEILFLAFYEIFGFRVARAGHSLRDALERTTWLWRSRNLAGKKRKQKSPDAFGVRAFSLAAG